MQLPPQVLDDPLPAEPLERAAQWAAEAWSLRAQPNANAMVLATVSATGQPSARVVLCKEIVARPGFIAFYSNYDSHKGRELAANRRAAIVMHWDHQHRQVRVEGLVIRAPAAESDAYYASRPWQRRIGAWASAQSAPVASRAQLQRQVAEAAARFGVPVPGPDETAAGDPGIAIPRPPQWGGYHLWADAVELWVEGESRIHDRVRWTRRLAAAEGETPPHVGTTWTATRLQP